MSVYALLCGVSGFMLLNSSQGGSRSIGGEHSQLKVLKLRDHKARLHNTGATVVCKTIRRPGGDWVNPEKDLTCTRPDALRRRGEAIQW